jgi:hypothetical protein
MKTSHLRSEYDLMLAVAWHLSGKSVRLRMTRPSGCDGVTWCDELGRITIDVDPDLDDPVTVYVLLHETAHCRLHTFRPVTEKVMQSTPLSTSLGQSVREDQADYQAKVWQKYGEDHRDWSYNYLQGVLTPLLTYKDG